LITTSVGINCQCVLLRRHGSERGCHQPINAKIECEMYKMLHAVAFILVTMDAIQQTT